MKTIYALAVSLLVAAAVTVTSAGAYSYRACTANQPAHRELSCATHNLYHAQYTLQWVKQRSLWIKARQPDLLAFDFPLAATQNKLARMHRDMHWLARESKRDVAEAHHRLYRLRHPAPQRHSYYYGGSAVSLGQAMAAKYGWVGYEWQSLYTLWMHESGWDPTKHNPHSAACGIPQAMNDCAYGYNPVTQIAWGLSYILGRYGRPSAALAHWTAFNWY